MKRFWKTAEVVEQDGGFGIMLDGRPVKGSVGIDGAAPVDGRPVRGSRGELVGSPERGSMRGSKVEVVGDDGATGGATGAVAGTGGRAPGCVGSGESVWASAGAAETRMRPSADVSV